MRDVQDVVTDVIKRMQSKKIIITKGLRSRRFIATYSDMLLVFAMSAKEIMDIYIPEYGCIVKNDLQSVLEKVIQINGAKPKPETEKALENLKSFLERK